MKDERLKKLALRLDALAEKDDLLLRKTREIACLRQRAAMELYGTCRDFVANLNPLLNRLKLELQPEDYQPEYFSEERPNLLQINARGRVVQFEFSAPETLSSTEHFRRPYILEGSVRCFNQELLDRLEILEHEVFYCLDERRQHAWYWFDSRTYRSGLLNQDYLAGLMELLV